MPLHGKIVVLKRSGGDGTEFPLTASCMFGRNSDCDIRIQLPQVSKEHCRIDLNENKEVILTNLSNVNPTQVNGQALQQSERLKHGDVITIIDRSFRFEYPPPPTPKKRSSVGGKVKTTVADPHLKDGTNIDNIQRCLEKTQELESKEEKTASPFSDLYQMIKQSLDVKTPRKSSVSVPPSRFCTPKPQSARKNNPRPVEEAKDTTKTSNSLTSDDEIQAGDAMLPITPKSVKNRRSLQLTTEKEATPAPADSPRRTSTTQRYTVGDAIEQISQAQRSPLRRRSKETTPPVSAEKQVASPTKVKDTSKATPKSLQKGKAKPQKRKSEELAADLPKQLMKRKRVSFGTQLSPELFDKRLPPDSPLCKGATPRRSLGLYRPKQSLLRRASVIGLLTACENPKVKSPAKKKTPSPKKSSGTKSASPKTPTSPKKSPASPKIQSPVQKARSPKSSSPSSVKMSTTPTKAKSPAQKVLSPKSKSSSPGKSTPKKASPKTPKAPSLKVKTPKSKSPSSGKSTPKKASPKVPSLKVKTPKSKSPSPAKCATPKKASPKTPSPKSVKTTSAKSPDQSKSEMALAKPQQKSPKRKSTGPVGTPVKTPLPSAAQTPKVEGRFSVSRINTPSPIAEDVLVASVPSAMATPKLPVRTKSATKKTPLLKSATKKTPLLKSATKKTPLLKSATKVMRRKSSMRGSMKVITSWADIVKFGKAKIQVAFPAKSHVAKKTTKRKVVSKPQTPKRRLVEHASTGHAASPATIVVGRAHRLRVAHATGAPPKIATNAAMLRKDLKMDEDLTGISDMFKTPKNEKRRSDKIARNATRTPLADLNKSQIEPSVLNTPEETGEMVVSPMNASTSKGRRYNSEAVQRLLNEIPAMDVQSESTEQSTELIVNTHTTPKQKPQLPEGLTGVRRMMKTPKQKAEPVEDLRGRLLKTPKQKSEQQECLSAIKHIMKTPKEKVELVEDLEEKVVNTPEQNIKDQEECMTEVKQMTKTPKEKAQPVEDLWGSLQKTPKQKTETPECLSAVKRIMKTADKKVKQPECISEAKRFMRTPEQKIERQEYLTGVKRIMRTPKQKSEPIDDIRGKLLLTPKQTNEQQVFLTGVKRIMKTPKPKAQPVEKNFGLKRLMRSPRLRGNAPVEDFEGLEGLEELMKEPVEELLSENAEETIEQPECTSEQPAVDQMEVDRVIAIEEMVLGQPVSDFMRSAEVTERSLAVESVQEAASEAKLGQEAAPEATPGQEATPEAKPGQEAAPEEKPGQEAAPEAKPGQEAAPEAKPGQEAAPEAKPGQEAAPEAKPEKEAAPEAKPEKEAAPEAKPGQEAAPEAKPEKEAAPEAKPGQEAAPEAKPGQEAAPEAKPGQEAAPEAKPEKEAAPEAKPEKEAAPEAKPEKEAVPEAKPVRGRRAKAAEHKVEDNPSEETVKAPVKTRQGKKVEFSVTRQTARGRKIKILEERTPEEPVGGVQEPTVRPKLPLKQTKEETVSTEPEQGFHTAEGEQSAASEQPVSKVRRTRKTKAEPRDVTETAQSAEAEEKSKTVPTDEQQDDLTERPTKSARGRRAKVIDTEPEKEAVLAEPEAPKDGDSSVTVVVRGRRRKKTEAPAVPAVKQRRGRAGKCQEVIPEEMQQVAETVPEPNNQTCVSEGTDEIVHEKSQRGRKKKAPGEPEPEIIAAVREPLVETESAQTQQSVSAERPKRGSRAKIQAESLQREAQSAVEEASLPAVDEAGGDLQVEHPVPTQKLKRGRRPKSAAEPSQTETKITVVEREPETQPEQSVPAEKPKRGRKTKPAENDTTDIFQTSVQGRGKRIVELEEGDKFVPEKQGLEVSSVTAKRMCRTRKVVEHEDQKPEAVEDPPVVEQVKSEPPATKSRRGALKPAEAETVTHETTEEVSVRSTTDKSKRGRKGQEDIKAAEVNDAEHDSQDDPAPAKPTRRGRTAVSAVPAKRARRGAPVPSEESAVQATEVCEAVPAEPVKRGRKAAETPASLEESKNQDKSTVETNNIVEEIVTSKRSIKWKSNVEVIEITPLKGIQGRKTKSTLQNMAETVMNPEEKDLSEKAQPAKRARRGVKAADVVAESAKPSVDMTEAETQPKTRRGRGAKK